MKYLIFSPRTENELENVFKSLSLTYPELDSSIGILVWTDDEDIYLKARNEIYKYLENINCEVRFLFSPLENKVKSIKETLNQVKGSVILVSPNHILKFGVLSALYFSDRLYKYGFIAGQLHDDCLDSVDLYDELAQEKSPLVGHDKLGDDMYLVDNTFDATYLVKIDNFMEYWLDDGNLGVYLKRLGFCNYIDKSLNISRG